MKTAFSWLYWKSLAWERWEPRAISVMEHSFKASQRYEKHRCSGKIGYTFNCMPSSEGTTRCLWNSGFFSWTGLKLIFFFRVRENGSMAHELHSFLINFLEKTSIWWEKWKRNSLTAHYYSTWESSSIWWEKWKQDSLTAHYYRTWERSRIWLGNWNNTLLQLICRQTHGQKILW